MNGTETGVGLPFVRPEATVGTDSPESIFEQQVKAGRNGIQQAFQQEWDLINQRARTEKLNPAQVQQLLNGAQVRARREASEFNQQAKMNINNLKELDQLAKTGAIIDATEAKWRIVLGPEAERAMFPKAEKSAMQQYSELNRYRTLLEKQRDETFKEHTPWFGEPELQIWDQNTGRWSSEITPQERELAGRINIEIEMTKRKQASIIKPKGTSDLMREGIKKLAGKGDPFGKNLQDYIKTRKRLARTSAWMTRLRTPSTPSIAEQELETPDMGDKEKYDKLIQRGWTPEQIEQALGE